MARARSKQALRAAFVVLVAVALALTIRSQGPRIGDAFARTGPGPVLLSLLAAMAGLLASAFCWRALLASLGTTLPPRIALHVFFVGQIGKYLPGNVFAVAAQAELARDHDVPRTRIITAGLMFLGVLTTTGLLVAAATLPFTSPGVLRTYGWALLALPFGLAALWPPVLERLIRLGLRVLKRPAPDQRLERGKLAQALGWVLVMWLLYGVHLLPLVLAQPHQRGHNLFLVSTGGYALAWTAGFLFVIAPAGAGIRELVLVLALAGTAHHPQATAVALISRGVQTLGDLLWALIGLALKDRRLPSTAATEATSPASS